MHLSVSGYKDFSAFTVAELPGKNIGRQVWKGMWQLGCGGL